MNPNEYSSVLIVDDNENDLVTLARLLESAGFTPPFATVESGALAKELLRNKGHLFQLAFFDLRMPVCDGLELLAWTRLRPNLSHLKVVMITGDDDPDIIARAQDLGADGFFAKYPRPGKLAAIMSGITPDLIGALAEARPA